MIFDPGLIYDQGQIEDSAKIVGKIEGETMNKDMFDSKWKEIRSQTIGWWGLMHEDDLKKVDKAPVKIDKYVTLLQVKYGYTRKGAKEEIRTRVAEFEARKAEALEAAEEK